MGFQVGSIKIFIFHIFNGDPKGQPAITSVST